MSTLESPTTSLGLPETNGQPSGRTAAYERPPLVLGPHEFKRISDIISTPTEQPPALWWWPAFFVAAVTMLGGVFAACYLITTGIGVWGSNIPVGWAFDITNFVFWIGIGHAGTLISAILFLFRQKWRTSINRFAEAMTIFAVICAAIYPGIHVGRFWYVWFMFPLPNANHIWPNFRSALLWDLFAVSTYFTVSMMFWYIGLVPDLATLRDRAKSKIRQIIFGILSLGWRGSTQHWRHYEVAYLMLAGLSTPLVLSVHSVVSFDFATSIEPGWHTTIFPPYFVAGAIFGGFAMVLTCVIPVREMYPKIKDLVTTSHLDVMAKFILATGTMVGYAYAMEFFVAWYSGNVLEWQIFIDRATGDYAWAYWTMVSCNLFIPQLLWFRWFRVNPMPLFAVSVAVNLGMWFERFVIIVQSLARDNLPASWGNFYPTWVDWLQMIGDFGLFFTLTLLFIRFFPMISMAEVKGILHHAQPHGHADAEAALNSPAESSNSPDPIPTYGGGSGIPQAAVARFAGPDELLEAAKKVRAAGYKQIDAYTPYPVHGMVRAIGKPRSRLSLYTLVGAFTGLGAAVLMQFYLSAYYYPIIVGGKEYSSWEGFVPICFEMTILFAGFGTLFGLLALCGLPRLFSAKDYHPDFTAVTDDGFFLTIEASDPRFDRRQSPALLRQLGGTEVAVVEE